jgi:3-hydroxyacyl-CoA dehydrogenase/enoyl-CoA hydratase/3-hydroxybutyryl-CoA epimerase
MENKIQKICIIGAGIMGANIAALIANASYEVILLDIVANETNDRNIIVQKAMQKLLVQKPYGLSHPNRANFIKLGNIEDDLHLISECDLIIEVIIEKIAIKHDLYKKLLQYLKPNCIIASNTSTLPLKQLKLGLPDDVQSRFLITHFFNPPRYMELVELVVDSTISKNTVNNISVFLTSILGKTIVECNDTPGFIANRIGCFLLELVVSKAIKENLDPVIIDYIFSKYFYFPSTSIFGLYDLIGHDVMKLISSSLVLNLPNNDYYKKIYDNKSPLLNSMIEKNLIGRKGDGGFYRIQIINGKKIKQVINFSDESYNNLSNVEDNFISLNDIIYGDGIYQKFFKEIICEYYLYVTSLIPNVTNNIYDIDKAMKLGYSLNVGPFELLSFHIKDGFELIKKYAVSQNLEISNYLIQNAYMNIVKDNFHPNDNIFENSKILLKNESASFLHFHGKLIFTIHTKMNILNEEIFKLLLESIIFAETHDKNLYIYSETNFSAGLDLKFLAYLIENKEFQKLDDFLKLGQQTMMRMKYSTINIISCVSGIALGGGCELLLHSSYIVATQDLNAGLVEMNLGLIPAFGGIKEMFIRSQNNEDMLLKNLQNILYKNQTNSADYFVVDYNISNIEIIMNRHELLSHAFKIDVCSINKTKKIENFDLPSLNLQEKIQLDKNDKFSQRILIELQKIIDLGNVTEEQILDYERKIFIDLAKDPNILLKIKV